eukprot:CAMPEP_0203920434 /NCGR_PEP_ID=MMETSP0359-20131031/60732_1 /ASSEMBLY_ACC=CAM_ASM_000338 /TAXON_ID=268821 /ORGANISM="Scrippsiella Hangoei, Strain SHTV-5" /LENGTH=36 /DNA_ID= /DNA_START= /DNA_END= /DNA_ORIENTATION=
MAKLFQDTDQEQEGKTDESEECLPITTPTKRRAAAK